MTLRSAPTDDDVYTYDLTIQYGGAGLGGPSLHGIMLYGCGLGDDEGIHDDAEHADEYAGICELFRTHLERNRTTLTINVSGARRLHAALMSAWSYADQNNYGADDEPDAEAHSFGAYGRFMLGQLAHPWRSLNMPDDGSCGFTHVKERP